MCRISPALSVPAGVLRLGAVSTAPALCILARKTEATPTVHRVIDRDRCASPRPSAIGVDRVTLSIRGSSVGQERHA